MYNITKDPAKLENCKKLLNYIYQQIPDTKGCMDNIDKEGGCGAWCCAFQNPQVLYSEFLLTWDYISKNWDDTRIAALIERSLENYFLDRTSKGCVFWDRDTRKCSQHESRPFNCRIYGITPEEEWKPRYERLKILYPDTREQCGLVSTEDGSEVTKNNIDKWWSDLKGAEHSIGIDKDLINDEATGSYRTYHDHVLLHFLGEDGLFTISDIREFGSEEDKKNCITQLINAYWSYQNDLKEHSDD